MALFENKARFDFENWSTGTFDLFSLKTIVNVSRTIGILRDAAKELKGLNQFEEFVKMLGVPVVSTAVG